MKEYDLHKDREGVPTNIVHAKKGIVRFVYRNRVIDLRTASISMLRLIAKDPFCGVLTIAADQPKKETPPPSSPEDKGAANGGKKKK